MRRRVYSPKDILAKKYTCLEWGEKWSGPFGFPPVSDAWFICGKSASGKSSFVMQLAKELCSYGKVIYESYEEGVSQSFQDRCKLFNMGEEEYRFQVTRDSYEELCERLAKPRSPQFIIIDSVQMSTWKYTQLEALVKRFPRKGFVFVSQERKGQPMGTTAQRLRYLAGVKVWVQGFKAYCQGRFTGEPGSYYPVWEDGILKTSNNL